MSALSGIEFLWPFVFLLLPLPFLIRHFVKPAPISANGALRVPFFQRINQSTGKSAQRSEKNLWRMVLASIIWILLVTAVARPVLVGNEVPLRVEGRDLMVAIDLSGSMGREDFGINGRVTDRLTVVKAAADDFIKRRKGDRIGLVLFSDRAYLQAPLTFDRTVVRKFLDEAQVGLTGQQTAIGDAIAISVKRLKNRPAKSRVLVLLTDGINNSGVLQPLQAAELAKELGIRIYTIGVGARPTVVQTAFGRQIVNSSQGLDEKTLTKIAKLTGGQYFRATDINSLMKIYSEIDKLEPASGDPLYMRPSVSLYFLPLGLALGLASLFAFLLIIPAGIYRLKSVTPKGSRP